MFSYRGRYKYNICYLKWMRYLLEYIVEVEIGEVLIISLNGINLYVVKVEISKILLV